MNTNMARQFAAVLLRTNREQEFDITYPADETSIENIVAALERFGCRVVRETMYLHIERTRCQEQPLNSTKSL